MSIHKFGPNDVFVNTIKTFPHSKFTIYNGDITYRAEFPSNVREGSTALFDLNVDIVDPYVTFDNSLDFQEVCDSQCIVVTN